MSYELDNSLGCTILEFVYGEFEYDLADMLSVIPQFIPANYIISRRFYQQYLWSDAIW
jgi:hypothetical protein